MAEIRGFTSYQPRPPINGNSELTHYPNNTFLDPYRSIWYDGSMSQHNEHDALRDEFNRIRAEMQASLDQQGKSWFPVSEADREVQRKNSARLRELLDKMNKLNQKP